MAGYLVEDTRKVTTHRLIEMKQQGKKIAMLTSYDYTMARIVDGAGVDVILIGDSASNVMAGNTTTLPITLNQMIYHATSVMHGVERALVVCDMPFGSYQGNEMEGLASAIRIMKESHADALKLEGGVEIIDAVKKIFAEFAFGHHLFQITIGGANQTYVDRYRFVASYSHHAPALNGGE